MTFHADCVSGRARQTSVVGICVSACRVIVSTRAPCPTLLGRFPPSLPTLFHTETVTANGEVSDISLGVVGCDSVGNRYTFMK